MWSTARSGLHRLTVKAGFLHHKSWLVRRTSQIRWVSRLSLTRGRLGLPWWLPGRECGLHFGQHACLLEYFTSAADDASQRVFGNINGKAGFLLNTTVEAAQQRAAAGEADALEHQVGDQLRRRYLD